LVLSAQRRHDLRLNWQLQPNILERSSEAPYDIMDLGHDDNTQNVYQIRNIQLVEADLQPLVHQGKKINGTIVNAFGAFIQAKHEKEKDDTDFCIFSSWLDPLVTGAVKEGKGKLNINENILAAV
jgi:hypothetical protein